MSSEGVAVTITIHPVWWDIWRAINIIVCIVLLTLQIRRIHRRKEPMHVWEIDHQMSAGLWLVTAIVGTLVSLESNDGFSVAIPMITLALLFTARVMRHKPDEYKGGSHGREA
jgi:hypothetical protein